MSTINMQFHPLSSPSDRTSHLISLLSLFVLQPDSLASLIHQTGLSFCFLACLHAPSKNCTLNWHSIDILYSLYFIRDNLPSYNPSVRMHAIFHSLLETSYNSQEVHPVLANLLSLFTSKLNANVTLRHLWPWVTTWEENEKKKKEKENKRETLFIFIPLTQLPIQMMKSSCPCLQVK